MIDVIGLDLSLTSTGIAGADGHLCVVTTVPKDPLEVRVRKIRHYLRDTLVGLGDVLAVIEDLPRGGMGAASTGPVHGVVRLELLDQGVPIALVTAATLKLYATGKGNASKADMRMALYQRAGIDEPQEDKVDAWWLRAAGLEHLGRGTVHVPAAQRKALDKVTWPTLAANPKEQ